MSVFVDKLYNYIQSKRNSGYEYKGTPIYNITKKDIESLEDVANYFGFRPEYLANLINFESGGTFNPAITNSIGATGLIQFMPSTAPTLGTSTSALRGMSFQQQMVYVKKYIYNVYDQLNWLDKNGNPIKNKASQIDLFMMIFYPVAVGKENYQFPQKVVAANNGIKTPKDYLNKAIQYAPFKKIIEVSVATQKYMKKNIVPIILISVAGMAIIGTVLYLVITKKIK